MKKKMISYVIVAIIAVIVGNFVLKGLYPLKYYDIVSENAAIYGIDPLFVMSIIKAESKFDERARSHKDAIGLMQILEDTGEWCAEMMKLESFTTADLYDPETNIKIGVWYFNYLLRHFDGDYTVAAAAYNAGMGNVRKWFENYEYSPDGETLQKVPFLETSRYITKVLNNYKIYKALYGKKTLLSY